MYSMWNTPWNFHATWAKTYENSMEFPWNPNLHGFWIIKLGLICGKICGVFHMESMESPWKISRLFPHGNSTGYETGTAILQDRRVDYTLLYCNKLHGANCSVTYLYLQTANEILNTGWSIDGATAFDSSYLREF